MTKKLLLSVTIATFAGFGGLTYAYSTATASDTLTASAEANISTATFSIAQMTCATCPISVKKAMKRVDGVKTVKVDFETKIATVTFDAAMTNADAIAAASTNVGYPATPSLG